MPSREKGGGGRGRNGVGPDNLSLTGASRKHVHSPYRAHLDNTRHFSEDCTEIFAGLELVYQ